MKVTIACIAAILLAATSVCYSQGGYVPGQPSIDCTKAHNTVAVILCRAPEAAQADWELNSALWARYFTLNDTQRRMLDLDQQAWRQSLDRICALPRNQTPEDQAGLEMFEVFGRMMLGPGVGIPGPPPITQAHVSCVLNAYHARAAMLRSKLTGDALGDHLAESGAARLLGGFDVDIFLRHRKALRRRVVLEQLQLRRDRETFLLLLLGGDAGIGHRLAASGIGNGCGLRGLFYVV